MNAREFHNALRIILNLDADHLLSAGVIDECWGTPEAAYRDQVHEFLKNPYLESLLMPDANFERLFALIESKQPRHASHDAGQVEAKEG